MIPHYYHENAPMENLCKLHGWGIREISRRVCDAILFSNELDILEVRWNELSRYASEFILLKSSSTFTGLRKPLVFAKNRHRFKFMESRLTYGTTGGRFVRGENPFVEESYQRVALDQLLRIAGITDDDLLIMSDVDEIPSGHTINLLKWCDEIPEKLHSSSETTSTLLSSTSMMIAGGLQFTDIELGRPDMLISTSQTIC